MVDWSWSATSTRAVGRPPDGPPAMVARSAPTTSGMPSHSSSAAGSRSRRRRSFQAAFPTAVAITRAAPCR